MKLEALCGNTVRIRMGKDNVWPQSGLNRYGIIDDKRMKDGSKPTVRNDEIHLSGGYRLKLDKKGAISA